MNFFIYISQWFWMQDASTVPGYVVKLYWMGTEVSECSADGNNRESYKCIPNLKRRQGDIYHTTSNRHTVIGSPAPTVRQRKNSRWVQKKKRLSKTNTEDVHHGCLLQSASNASQPVLALSMRLTGRAWLNCEASASAKRAEIWNPTGATHNRCLQFDRKDMGVREIWKQRQKWSSKRESMGLMSGFVMVMMMIGHL